MSKLALLFVILSLCLFSAFGQINQGGSPASFNKQISQILQSNMPTFTMPFVDVNRLMAEDVVNDQDKSIPWRFGENIDVNIDIKSNGLKDVLPNGDKIWRLRIYSSGAYSLNFTFDKYILPNNAKLYIYNEQKTSVFGAFTSFNNQSDQVFATTLIEGEAIIIEYFEPANVLFEGQLHLSRVTHGYRNVLDFTQKAAQNFGSSGSCEFNVKCPLASGWENEIRSVCMLVTNSSGFCTGALVNNTSNDGTPYVLTANHCSTSNNFSSWVFWFNWDSPTCNNPTSSPAYQSVSGCTLKARSSTSDFCLVQMNSTPPSNYNVYYAGWDKSGSATQNAYAIHHPSGDIKKFSHATSVSASFYSNVQCWNTFWAINGSGVPIEGVTEPGSSGSPIFDANHKVIGQLYGGPSSCSQTGASNVNDHYGRFSYSWDSCGTTSALRLKDWLDPTNINPPSIPGYDPNTPAVSLDASPVSIPVPLNSYCTVQTVSPKVVIRNIGSTNLTSLTVRYNIDSGPNVNFNWTGNLSTNATDTVVFPQINLTAGTHVFHASTLNPNSGTDENNANDTLSKAFTVAVVSTVPVIEDFESAIFPSVNWSIENTDGSTTWARTTQPAGNGTSTASAYLDFMNYATLNQKDALVTPKIDLSGSAMQLTFKVAYRRYNAQYSDSMKVLISTDCGNTYNTTPLYYKGGTTLATGADMTTTFFPTTNADWRLESVDLTPFVGNNIILKFVGINRNGNNLFLDDINIISLTSPPVADFTQSDTSSCTGVINFTDLSSNLPTSWLWNFGDGITSTEQNPTHTYSQNGYFNVYLICTNQFGSDSIMYTSIIHINLPAAPTTVSASRCGTGSVNLTASGSGNLAWFDTPTGGTSIGSGPTFTTPSLSSTTTYYVEDQILQPAQTAGIVSSNTNGSMYNQNTLAWLAFDCFTDINLISVDVNAGSTANREISLYNSAGVKIDSVILNIPAGLSTVNLNFYIPAGTGYRLTGSVNANMYRTQNGLSYPYVLPGVLSITNGGITSNPNLTTRYYYFYNWQVQQNGCISSRSSVTATINTGVVTGTGTASPGTICSGSTSLLTLSGSSGNIQWIQASSALGPWSNVTGGSGGTTTQYTTDVLTNQTWYAALVSSPGCTDDTSNIILVDVTAALSPGTASISQNNVCSGDAVDLLLTGSTGSIQWQYSLDGLTGWTNIPGATNAAYTTPALTVSMYARATLSSGTCPIVYSNIINVTVNPAITLTITSTNATAGNSDGTATANVSGGTGSYSFLWQGGQTTQTAVNLAAGNYSVTVSDGYCTVVSNVQITEQSGPVALFNTTPIAICSGNNINFTEYSTGNPTSWFWIFEGGTPSTSNQQSPTISYYSDGSFAVTLIVSNANGSDTLFADSVVTVSNIVINIVVTDESAPGAADGSATANVTGGVAPYVYNWSNNGTTQTISGLSAGAYSVIVIDNNGCMATSPAVVNVATAINQNSTSVSYSIHPNPVSSIMRIDFDGSADKIEILDMLGRKIYENNDVGKRLFIDMDIYQSGIYFVKVFAGTNVTIEKILLQK